MTPLEIPDVADVDVRPGDTATLIQYPATGIGFRFRAVAASAAPAQRRTPGHPALVNIRHHDRTWTATQLRDLAAIHTALADWLDQQQPDGQLTLNAEALP